jgi:DNA-binding response OmpR family regulator
VRSLRAERTTIPVLFISGCTELAAGQSELVSGVDFLQKPFAPSVLAQKVRAVLDRVRA